MAKQCQDISQGTPYSLSATSQTSFSVVQSECQGLEAGWGKEEEESINPPLSPPWGPHSGKLQSSTDFFSSNIGVIPLHLHYLRISK